MSYVLMAAGQHPEPIWGVVCDKLAGASDWLVRVLPAVDVQQLQYRLSSEPLERLTSELESGAIASVQLQRTAPRPALVGLYCPNFCGEPFSQWRCVVDSDWDEVVSMYRALRKSGTPSLASLWVDEAADLDSAALSAETFPWDDWRLIRASVRGVDGQWLERSGPAPGGIHEGGDAWSE